MILADVIDGFYLPYAYGWAFLALILVIEPVVLSVFLAQKCVHKRVFYTVVCSNLLTTLLGYIFSYQLSSGAALLRIPVDSYRDVILLERTVELFVLSFVATLLIELFIHTIMLMQQFKFLRILLGTLYVNVATYLIGLLLWYFCAYLPLV